ncbi:MAG: hypothetical protein H6750_21240 [Nitrospiraceae bacterium]|nr:hypothetical protein [Nitrospiraceae bacterium]MCB9776839.1 hypothetical protein [Nitrospiraceae bacterium]
MDGMWYVLRNHVLVVVFLMVTGLTQWGCDPTGAIIGSVVGTTAFTGLSPSNSLEQIYYLGVFDPQEQLPSSIYRVTVRGQASSFSWMNFGSGWVPSRLVDSLSTPISTEKKTGKVIIGKSDDGTLSELTGNRRLVLFGPEGFREAPKDHRLVIVMGMSPEDYFQAIDQALGNFARIQHEQLQGDAKAKMMQTLLKLSVQQERLKDFEMDARLLGLADKGN